MKKVMVLAGTPWQIPLIKKLKSMGCEVYDINLYSDSPAFALANHHCTLDILDKKSCLDYAKENGIDAIMSEQCDIATNTIAYIADSMGLPGIGEEMATLYTDKYKMCEFGKAHGIPVPEFKLCENISEAIDFFKDMGRRIIIKPLDSNSSRGVYIIDTEDDLKKYFDKSLSYSRNRKAVLCESYINGTEFTIDGIKTDNGHVCLAISEKHHYEYNPNIADELYFSHSNDRFDYELLKSVNDKFVNESGLPFGLTHAEYKFEDGKFYLIEIGARGGGNLIGSDIVPLMSGVDNYDYLIKKSLGIKTDENVHIADEYKNRCAVLKFFDFKKTGRVTEIIGTDYLDNCPNIITYRLNFGIGDELKPAADDSKRAGFYIAYADSDEELRKIMNEVSEKIYVEAESNDQ